MSIQDFYKELRTFKGEEITEFSKWATSYTMLKGKKFSFDMHEYQKAILDDTHPMIGVRKCVQVGVSEVLIRKLLGFLSMHQGTQAIYTFPTGEEVSKFVKTRVDPAIKDCSRIKELGFNIDNVKVKQIGQSFAHFKGSFGERETIAVPSDFNCFEMGTEILTKEGWKKIEELNLDDIVATRDEKGKAEWHKPYQLIDKEYKGNLMVFKHRRLELGVTPEHKMLIKRFSSTNIKKKNNEYILKEAKSLKGYPCFAMTVEAEWNKEIKEFFEIKNQKILKRLRGSFLLSKKEVTYSNKYPYIPFCKFLGWYLAEGYVRKLRGRIMGQICLTQTTQTKDSEDIRKVLYELGVKWYENKAMGKGFGKQLTSNFVFTDWALAIWLEKFGKSFDKYIPIEILENSYGLEELLIRLYLGDGMFHKEGKGREKYGILNTASKKLADTVQIAWLKLGKRATIRPFKEKSGTIMYRVLPVKCNYVIFNAYTNGTFKGKRKSGRVEKKFYKGKVYCLTVKNHIVMVRGREDKTPIWTAQCHDEIDFSKPDIQNLYRSRLEHSSFAWEIDCSTPSIPGYGIDKVFEDSDQRHWNIKCPHCNVWQELIWMPDKNKEELYNIRKIKNVWIYVCKKCGREINYSPEIKMEWVAKYPEQKEIHGYHLGPCVSWGYKKAGRIIKSFYDYKDITQAYNRVLGLAYTDPGKKLTRDVITKCWNNDLSMQHTGRNCFMAADQGPPSWAIIGEYDQEKMKIKILNIEKIDRNMFDQIGPGGEKIPGRFSELMEQFDVQSAVIDAQPNTESAYQFAKNYAGRIHICFYSDRQREKLTWKPEEFVVTANRTRSIDYAMQFWLDRRVEIFPEDGSNYHVYEALIKHLTGMVKVIDEDEHGAPKAMWRGHKDKTHFAHVWNYLCMATECEVNIINRVIDPSISGFSIPK